MGFRLPNGITLWIAATYGTAIAPNHRGGHVQRHPST